MSNVKEGLAKLRQNVGQELAYRLRVAGGNLWEAAKALGILLLALVAIALSLITHLFSPRFSRRAETRTDALLEVFNE